MHWDEKHRVFSWRMWPVLWVVVLLAVDGGSPRAQSSADSLAPTQAAAPVWSAPSPYGSLVRTKQFLDMVELRFLIDYKALGAEAGTWKLAGRSSLEITRFYEKRSPEGVTRTVEVAAGRNPSGGYEIYMYGEERTASGLLPNPELSYIEERITRLSEAARAERQSRPAGTKGAALQTADLRYEIYQLSNIKSDHALALLKTLGYSTVEYTEKDGESLYDSVYAPVQEGEGRLPLIVKLIDSDKTSLQEPLPQSQPMAMQGGGQRQFTSLLPDLGGIFLHGVTSGEPQQRLLIVYGPDDLEAVENLLNLLHEKVDVPARQILIEALVIEIERGHVGDIGVTFGVAGLAGTGRYEDKYDVTTGLQLPTDALQPLSILYDRTGVLDTFKFSASLHALIQKNQAQILSNPSVLVLDGRQAKIQIGTQIPVPEQTLTISGSTASVTYFPVGIVLNLRPRVNQMGDEIVMQVETVVSSVRATATLTSETTLTAPEVDSRVVQTFVRVANDTPFIIGGLTSNTDVRKTRGVPVLSQIPGLGGLFRRKSTDVVKREIIIVLTPHIVPQKVQNFSYVLPQEADVFDSSGRELFYNQYRIREQDIYDLDFVFQSQAYANLQACVRRKAEENFSREVPEELQHLLRGGMPGEEILVRRMLWEIITRRTDYTRLVDPSRMIVFEKTPEGTNVAFLDKALAARPSEMNAVALAYDAKSHGSIEHPFVQPVATVSFESVSREGYMDRLARGNARTPDGTPEQWTILLSDEYGMSTAPMEILKGVLVLKRVLQLNQNLPLTIEGFHVGRQIVFPTEADLRERFHLVDDDTARLFYEVTRYYPAFEDEFKVQARKLAKLAGGCPGWESGGESPGGPEPMTRDDVGRDGRNGGEAPAAGREKSALPEREKNPLPEPARKEDPERGASAAVIPSATVAVETAAPAMLDPDAVDALDTASRVAEARPEAERAALAGKIDAARAAFVQRRPAEGYREIGRILLEVKMRYAALKFLAMSAGLDPSDKDTHGMLADIYLWMGDSGTARKHREAASGGAGVTATPTEGVARK